MLSMILLERVEAHWQSIADSVIEQTRKDPNTPHHQELDDEALHARARAIVQDLRQWVSARNEAALANRYQQIGRARFQEHIPLAELIYKTQLIELKTVEYIQDANVAQSAVQIFGELEILRALHRFFAIVNYNLVRGYEEAATDTWARLKYATL